MTTSEVTVICATYNHERYIADALQGFVTQVTSFRFRVLVGDDASSDATASVIEEYAERYPEIIIPILRETNIGAGRNWEDLISRVNSKYIAFCDGDDYWIDSLKLQKQFDYMESHPDLRACFHDAEISIETSDGTWFQSSDYNNTDDGRLLWPSGNKRFVRRSSYRIENFIPFGFVHTSSMFVRWDYRIGFPDWFFGHGMSDYPMWVLQVNSGRFGYLDETLSIHRRTDQGSYRFESQAQFWRKTKSGWVDLDTHLIRYFRQLHARKSIVDALVARQGDDLAKLIKGSLECDPPSETWNLLADYRKVIRQRFGVIIPKHRSKATFTRVTRLLQTVAPLPPYDKNWLSRLIRRVRRKKERYYLRME